MINIVTSHNKIWDADLRLADIINEYQTQGYVTINMNREGPCADSVGLYRMLDYICEQFGFDKTKFTIYTCNAEELHDHYQIKIGKNFWFCMAHETSKKWGFDKESFLNKKVLDKYLFGCMYNIPSWNRLCLLSYIKFNTTHPSLLACNGTWESHQHNSYYLDTITDFCPEEFNNIVKIINAGINPLPNHPGHKPESFENTKILEFYNEFFVDVVAETYSNGLAFFPTEKTIRPIYSLTPFIVYGPQGFLSNLKSRYGFKTFDRWWDEGYDDYQNYDRIKHLYKIMDFLDGLTITQRHDMYKEMMPVLMHNYDVLDKYVQTQYLNS